MQCGVARAQRCTGAQGPVEAGRGPVCAVLVWDALASWPTSVTQLRAVSDALHLALGPWPPISTTSPPPTTATTTATTPIITAMALDTTLGATPSPLPPLPPPPPLLLRPGSGEYEFAMSRLKERAARGRRPLALALPRNAEGVQVRVCCLWLCACCACVRECQKSRLTIPFSSSPLAPQLLRPSPTPPPPTPSSSHATLLPCPLAQACVRWALAHRRPLTVVGGGHSGHCAADGVLAVSLRHLSGVRVDAARREVTAGGGAVMGDVAAEAEAAGLAVTTGARPRWVG